MRKRILVIAITLMLILACISMAKGFSAYLKHSGIHHTADTFMTRFLAGDQHATYAMLTPEAQKIESYQNWGVGVQSLSSYFQGTKPVYDSAITGSRFTIFKYKLHAHNYNYIFNLSVTNQGKPWQVVSYTSVLQ